MASATRIRVLLADDHTVLRSMLRGILKQYPDIDIVGEATNGEDVVLMADKLRPAIVLMDINMPKLDGIEATQRIKANSIRIAILGLSVHGEGHATDAMLRAGAVAVVLKERAVEDLYNAIKRALTLPLDTTSVRADNSLKCRPEFIFEQAPELNSDLM
jgi:DNA-binding NarL/FixJ family response regulator